MKKLNLWLLACVLSSTVASAFAATERMSASEELKQLLQEGQSLKGDFEQRLYDRDRNLLQSTEGKFVVQRPGNFYWETFPPYEQIVVGNSDTLWVYDPDLEQVTVHDQAQQQQASPARLLSGDLEDLGEQYDVERSVKDNHKHFTLTSKDGDATFSNLELSYHKGALTGLEFEDNLGQVTELSFTNTKLNPEIESGLFQFQVPEGVDVIVDD